jgi:citrate synthase
MSDDKTKIVTGLGKAELHRVLVRNIDMTQDILGKLSFGQMTFLMLVGRIPSEDEGRMTDALLNVLVEHGMVGNIIAARFTVSTAPEAIQGAVAAALLGAGSVHLGSSEYCAKMLQDALPLESDGADLATTAQGVVEDHGIRRQRIAGIGHATHSEGDPRADRLYEIAAETGVRGRYCELLEEIKKAAEARHNRDLPINVTGAIAAIASDMGLQWQMAKAFALIGRTLGAMAHIGEELKNPMHRRISNLVRSNLSYEP